MTRMDGQRRDPNSELVQASKVLIARAIERSEGENPLHLAELALASRGKHFEWLKDMMELLLADGRLRQQGNTFKIVPGVDLSAPVSSKTISVPKPVPVETPPKPTPTENTSNGDKDVQPAAEEPVAPVVPAAPVWTPLAVPEKTEPLIEESSLMQYLCSSKSIRVGSVTLEMQFLQFVTRFCDSCPPLSPFRGWWGHGSDTAAQTILDRLASLKFVQVEVLDTSPPSKRLTWDVNALAKYAAEHPPPAATVATPTPAPATATWTPAMLEADVTQVKKMLLHQLKMFKFYRIQNIHRAMQPKHPDPSFALDSYVDHIVHALEKDKRLVLAKDESGNPAFAWADKAKAAAGLADSVEQLKGAAEVAANAMAGIIRAALSNEETFSLGLLRQKLPPSGVVDMKGWIDLVVAALWKEYQLHVVVDGDVLRRDGKRRREDAVHREIDDDEAMFEESFFEKESHKRRKIHEVYQPVMEWSEPKLVAFPSTHPNRPVVVETAETKLQENRAVLVRSRVEVPPQPTPRLPTKRIALDFDE
ncbi:hypothetical protein AC1031_014463 [Aphanomyces cochlioides]|nr:hypothetical protein AC1031_014463 [Aphanomyces cochlioides]